MNENSKGSFSSKIGFVLATAGSAVGLGNIWRFPYLAAKYGGGIFLLTYIVIAVTFGLCLMTTELAIGRKTGLSAIGAYEKLNKKWKWIGVLTTIVPFLITPYYCVIGGWICKYAVAFVSGEIAATTSDTYFTDFISSPVSQIIFFAFFIICTAVVLLFGVKDGIEKASKIMMPALVILTLIIAVFIVTREGAIDGVIYYLKPDFSNFSATTVLAAMGQLFYSMSLAMAILITYGSYTPKSTSLTSSTKQVAAFDFGIAFLAGMMIIPAVFVYSGGDPAALGKGPGLMFVTLPKVFAEMTGGTVIGVLFFVMVFFAALTSSISLMEACVSILCDVLPTSRKTNIVLVTVFCLIVGAFVSLGFGPLDFVQIMGMGLLDFFDFASNSVLMPIVAFLTCIFVGYVIKPKTIIDEVEINGPYKGKKFYVIMIKYIAPVMIVGILLFSIMEVLGFIKV